MSDQNLDKLHDFRLFFPSKLPLTYQRLHQSSQLISYESFIQSNCIYIQMQVFKQLNTSQQDEFNRIRAIQNGLQEKTLEQSVRFYLEYKKNTGNIPLDKISIFLKSALFVAEKSTCCTTVHGERIAQPSLTLGNLLKSHSIDDVMLTLKEFTKNVNISDKDASAQLNTLIKQISFLLTYHKKFEKTIQKFELRERHPQSNDYVKQWSHFAWLLYVQVRNKLLSKSLDLIENTCMLAHTLAFMLSFSWEHIVPFGIIKLDARISEQSQLKEVVSVIRNKILDMFAIKTIDIYTSLANTFENFFEGELIKKGVIKTHQNLDFLSPDLLQANYRRLDKYYEKNMNGIDLDERLFLKQRAANLTPSKFTPFARQGYANKGRKSGNSQLLRQNLSHRVLNYQMGERIDGTVKVGSQGITMGRLPKAVIVSPSMMKVPLILATPISAGMEMMNYINEKSRKFQETLSQGFINKKPHEASVLKYIDLLFDRAKKDSDKKARQVKEQMVYSFFKLALEQYLSQHPSQKDNEKCYRGLMAISIELTLFANNSSLSFQQVQREVGLQPFEIWKACDFFLKFDRAMPSSLKLHLLDLEVSLISHKVWRNFDFVQAINDFANGQQPCNQFIQRFFKRLLHQTAFQINQLGDRLKLDDKASQSVYDIMKHVISQCTEILLNRHIDQLIMCSLFAVNRKEKLDIKFAEIIEAYKQANYYNRDLHQTIVKQIPFEEKQPLNLISFYNQCFIKRLKDFIMSLKPSSQHNQENKKNYSNNPILMSPLKDILPKDLNRKNRLNKNQSNLQKQLLIAYTDSPLLKHQPLAFKAKDLKSATGMINFDEEKQIIKNNLEEKKDYQKHSPRNINHNDYGTKKPNFNNMISGQSNFHWKNPDPIPGNGSLTPNRSKNTAPQQTIALNQFSSNQPQTNVYPQQQARISINNPLSNKQQAPYGMGNMIKGLRKYP